MTQRAATDRQAARYRSPPGEHRHNGAGHGEHEDSRGQRPQGGTVAGVPRYRWGHTLAPALYASCCEAHSSRAKQSAKTLASGERHSPTLGRMIDPNLASRLAEVDARIAAVAADSEAGEDIKELAGAIHHLVDCIRDLAGEIGA